MEGIILSSWDHIMGPQIEKLWLVNDNKVSEVSNDVLREFNVSKHYKALINSETNYLSDMKIYSMMCGQLLLGEVDSCKPPEEWASRFYRSEYKILIAVVFHLDAWMCCINDTKDKKDVCFCFGTILKHDAVNLALHNQLKIDLHLRKAVDILKNSKVSLKFSIKEIDVIMEDIAALLDPTDEFKVVNLKLYPEFKDFICSDLMSKAIVSHLQTSGCTAVIGGSEVIYNRVIHVLSMFCSEKEPYCSQNFPRFLSCTCIQGIYIQSKDVNKECKHILKEAFEESIALTVVDINLHQVWQTMPIQGSSKNRHSFIKVTETGLLVPHLLQDLMFIYKSIGDYELFVENFYKYLMIESVSLIKAVEHFRSFRHSFTTKDIMTMFELHNDVDLKILFGCAEKLKPGFRTTLLE